MGPEERKLLQNLVDDVHDQFITEFMTARKITKKQAKILADGRIFTGRQALKLGVIDGVGSFQDALNIAQKMANLSGEPNIINKANP